MSTLKDGQTDLDAVASSYSLCLGTSELVTTPSLYDQAMLALRGYRYITYFEIWASNNKIINTYWPAC